MSSLTTQTQTCPVEQGPRGRGTAENMQKYILRKKATPVGLEPTRANPEDF